jgi:hypothetical protein
MTLYDPDEVMKIVGSLMIVRAEIDDLARRLEKLYLPPAPKSEPPGDWWQDIERPAVGAPVPQWE